jgi:hypothetical protein
MRNRLSTPSSLNSFFIKEYKEYFHLVPKDMTQSSANIFNSREMKETALEAKLKMHLSCKNLLRQSSKLFSTKEIKKLSDDNKLQELGVFSEPNEEHLTIRQLPNISEEQYIQKKNSVTDSETLIKLCQFINNNKFNFKDATCGTGVGGISPLTYLVEMLFFADKEKLEEMELTYDLLKPYINNYRTICGEGNCFYRAVMFRYLEILILNKNITILQKVVYDLIESFNSKELQNRKIINGSDIKPDLSFKILFLIIDLLKHDMVSEAHQIFIKCLCICQKFDYALILYFRYILYKYIRENENKIYLKSFPVKLGNLLPNQFERDNGEFMFNDFYEKFLLKFFVDAEKIVIYLTPFVLGIKLNVIVSEINDSEILQKFGWEGESEIKTDDEISLLNNKNHYEVIYTKDDEEKYKQYFLIYENNLKPFVLFKDVKKNTINTTDITNIDNNKIHSSNEKINYSVNQINNNNNSNKNSLKTDINLNSMKPKTVIVKKLKNSIRYNNDNDKMNNDKGMTLVGDCQQCEREIISANKKSTICASCFKQKIFNLCLNMFQNEKNNNPIESLKNNKTFDKFIIEYNTNYKQNLDKNEMIERIKSNECILKEEDSNIEVYPKMPCGCILCQHLIEYFKKLIFNRRFICKCNRKYEREDMIKLGVIFCKKMKDISKKITDYFQKRLISNCCFCFEKLSEKDSDNNIKFVQKSYYINSNANEKNLDNFINGLGHYFCNKCSYNKIKSFDCKICNIKHFLF